MSISEIFTESQWLVVDWIACFLSAVWFYYFYSFLSREMHEELDLEGQSQQLSLYGSSLAIIVIYAGFGHSQGRHINFWNSIVGIFTALKNLILKLQSLLTSCLPEFLLSPLRYICGFLHLSVLCYYANIAIDWLIYLCIIGHGAVFMYLIVNEMDIAFWGQSFLMQILYYALLVKGKENTVSRFVNHLGYICLHLGCLGQYVRYESSYYGIHVGLTINGLNFIWYLLNCPPSERQPPGQQMPSGASAGDSPRGDDPRPTPRRSERLRQKSQKSKTKRQ